MFKAISMPISDKSWKQILALIVLLNFASRSTQNSTSLRISSNDVSILVGETVNLRLQLAGTITTQLTVNFNADHPELVLISPSNISIPTNSSDDWRQSIRLLGSRAGHVEVIGSVFPGAIVDDSTLFIRVIVAHSAPLIIISSISGWIYFATWSISYYPQIWLNIRRKSVVGLDFDYLALNVLGHTLYTLFNFSLYFITPIENEYFKRFPRGLNPVKINDVVYSIHALTLTIVTIGTCFVYERGNQRISRTAKGILFLFFTIIIVTFAIAAAGVFHWLDFLYVCSYIKLAITPIKYIPQVITHYRKKSTAGWSISAVNLDVVGGVLSMLQMILNSYNYNDWQSLFGDPTKFGLGLISTSFDVVFIVQHYFLYREPNISGSGNGTKLSPSNVTPSKSLLE